MGGSEDVLTGDGLLRMIFEESIIGITVIGPDRRVLVANAAIRRMFGYTEAELATMRVTDVIHPGEVDEVIARFQELMTGARDSYQVERRYRRRDGSEFWGRLLVSIHRGERPLIIGMLEDITARRETVHALGERVKELTCLHRTAPHASCSTSSSRARTACNASSSSCHQRCSTWTGPRRASATARRRT
ncbi:MAG: PAS domain S-box protein [Deltaproteobacteria bacterium]|nr:PAS domain S-box protein [Kofleriaceae bacterium]